MGHICIKPMIDNWEICWLTVSQPPMSQFYLFHRELDQGSVFPSILHSLSTLSFLDSQLLLLFLWPAGEKKQGWKFQKIQYWFNPPGCSVPNTITYFYPGWPCVCCSKKEDSCGSLESNKFVMV